MPDQTPTACTIVPWVRRGLASLISGATTTNYATMPVTLSVNGASVNGPAMRLIGPGQITALDARAVVRTDPRNGATAFEPNYLAMVELAQPDLPWMFSPAPEVNGRVQPWICLLVLPDADGVVLESAADGISILRIQTPLDPKMELPDLSTIDAWAHAQVTGANVTGADLTNALNDDPANTVSRLVAARKLEANKSYIACIVPTYRAGVNSALGLPVDDHDLAPAWNTSVLAPFLLPAYYVFRFHTGEGGDFASLAQKLRPPKQKLNAGTRSIDVSQPGFGAAGVAGTVLGLEGALKAVDSQSTPWPAGAQETYVSEFRAALAPPAAADPVIAPPTYGSAQSGSALPDAGAVPEWLGELNLDPRWRVAASVGAQIVQRDQEALAASAWDQLGEIRKANQLLRQAQLARQVSTSLNQRHLERVAGDGEWLQITSPVHSRVRVVLAGVTATTHGQILASRLPPGSLSPAMRKIARPGGTIGRQLQAGVSHIVDRLNTPTGSATAALEVAGPVQPPRGMIGLDDVSPDFQVKNMTAASVISATGWKLTAAVISETGAISRGVTLDAPTNTGPAAPLRTSATPGRPAGPIVKAPLIDWATNPNIPDILKIKVPNLPLPIVFPSDSDALETVKADFKIAAQAINTYLNTAPAAPHDAPPLGGQASLAPVRAQLQAHLNPADTLRARLGARMPLNTGADPLQSMEVGPKYPQPMYAPLAQLSPDWMLPGISTVEAECATLLATNAKFIEAYMVGLNEELCGELLWREFPVDRRITFFQNFWAASSSDIGPIASFDASGALGAHVASPSEPTRFVLLIRATLFQRYPNAMVYAAAAKWVNGVRTLTDEVQYPMFRGNIGADVNFFGFDIDDPRGSAVPNVGKPGWYFVIAEHVTEPRLGLEPKTSVTRVSWNDLSWQDVVVKGNYLEVSSAPPKPAAEPVGWSENSAALAYILVRRPVRVAMHALALLGEQT